MILIDKVTITQYQEFHITFTFKASKESFKYKAHYSKTNSSPAQDTMTDMPAQMDRTKNFKLYRPIDYTCCSAIVFVGTDFITPLVAYIDVDMWYQWTVV